jgi:hypothetical protein
LLCETGDIVTDGILFPAFGFYFGFFSKLILGIKDKKIHANQGGGNGFCEKAFIRPCFLVNEKVEHYH